MSGASRIRERQEELGCEMLSTEDSWGERGYPTYVCNFHGLVTGSMGFSNLRSPTIQKEMLTCVNLTTKGSRERQVSM